MKPCLQVVNVDCKYEYAYERERLKPLNVDLVLKVAQTEDEIIALCSNADIVLMETVHTPMTAKVIAALKDCRALIKYSVGYENIDVGAASQRGIVVANSADFCTEEVSDHTVALILGSVRRIASRIILVLSVAVRFGRPFSCARA